MTDIRYMKQCLSLAKKAIGWTYPNPLVGAVIVKDGIMLSTGYHKRYGGPHAEIDAIRRASSSLHGSTLYVNLEPCSHIGKTPPCTDAIIRSGISHVVCAVQDPHRLVSGKGIETLQKAGIRVTSGVLEKEATQLNEQFFLFHTQHRPWVSIKFACSLDGVIATHTGDASWITSEKARSHARILRSQHQAVLVGVGTVIADDPHLGCRIRGKKDPLRIVLDSTLRSPLQSNMFRDNHVLVITSSRASKARIKEFQSHDIDVYQIEHDTINIPDVMRMLYEKHILSILVEGGGTVIGSFFDAGYVDKVFSFHAPMLIGGASAHHAIEGKGVVDIHSALRLQHVQRKIYDDTLLTVGYPLS